jgi:hypothetical protein
VVEVRETLAVCKQQRTKPNEVEGTKQYQVKIPNSLAALENLDDGVDINRSWGTIRKNIKISAKESTLL